MIECPLTAHCTISPSLLSAASCFLPSRAKVYEQVVNKVLGPRLSRRGHHPYEFYIDLTDGTRANEELALALGVPILSASRSPEDPHRCGRRC